MRLDLDNLPHDMALLHSLVRDMAAQVSTRDDEIERLRQMVKELQRLRFGRRSERLDPDQLALGLEDLDVDIAALEPCCPAPEPLPSEPRPRGKPLPDHLVREDVLLDVAGGICPDCSGHPNQSCLRGEAHPPVALRRRGDTDCRDKLLGEFYEQI